MSRTSPPYKAQTISGAEREVRRLRRFNRELLAMLDEYAHDRVTLAKFAADGPAFDNPIVVMEAKKLRDSILRDRCRLAPDGRPLA